MKLLEFNNIKFHAIEWEDKVGFLNTEIYKVLELPYIEYIPKFLKSRNNINNKENDDYLILEGEKAYKFKSLMRLNGIKDCKFRKALFIYKTGIIKFLNEYTNEKTEEFKQYLFENNIINKCEFEGCNKVTKDDKQGYLSSIQKYKNKECRVVIIEDEKWAVANDVCDILKIKYHLLNKLSDNDKKVVKTKIKTNAMKPIRVVNIKGIYKLMQYTIESSELIHWFEYLLTKHEQESNQMELDLDNNISLKEKESRTKSDINKNESIENMYCRDLNKKRIDQMYNTIEMFNKWNLPNEIKIQYISSLLASEGIIDTKILNQTKKWMESNTSNIANHQI